MSDKTDICWLRCRTIGTKYSPIAGLYFPVYSCPTHKDPAFNAMWRDLYERLQQLA